MMKRPTYTLVLEETKMIAQNVKHFGFSFKEESSFDYIPGQFLTIHFEKDGETLRRSYSIGTVATQSDLIEFAASEFPGGPGTEYLYNLKNGDEITVTGPFGRLVLRDEMPKRYLLISTGTGVTPYRAMLPELSKRLKDNPDCQVVLLLGVRDRDHAIYQEDFIKAAGEHSNFQYIACYSRVAEGSDLDEHERSGYVQDTLKDLGLNAKGDIVYLCGNPNMVDTAYQLLQSEGFATAQVRREKYVS